MNRKITALFVVAAVSLMMPAALADWAGVGSFEPDTSYDRNDGFMFPDADASANLMNLQVYFNGYAEQYPLTQVRDNPNSALIKSRVLSPNLMSQDAILGVWKDCNGDGYIGYSDTAVLAYPAVLTTLPGESSVCPPLSPFNDGEWITEFLAIGNTAAAVLRDDKAQVWADIGTPGGEVHFDCPHEPVPYGTSGSTGGLLMWADCFTAFQVTQAINQAADAAGQPGLKFDDAYHPERECDSPLQQDIPVWGNPQRKTWCGKESNGVVKKDTEDQSATVFDCDAEPTAEVRDPTAPDGGKGDFGRVEVKDPTNESVTLVAQNTTDEDGHFTSVYAPALAVHNPTGSYYQALNQTEHYHCDHGAVRTLVVQNFVGERGLGIAETNFAATNPADGKRLIDFPMSFSSGVTGTAGANTGARSVQNLTIDNVQVRQRVQGLPHWNGQFVYLSPTYNGGTVRNDLQPAGAFYVSLYARVGTNTTAIASLPSATPGIYASEVCSGTTAKVGSWDCNPEHWYRTDLGGYEWPTAKVSDNPAVLAYGPPVVPGVAYHLRDVDCYDGQVVGGVPVYASLAQLSGEGVCG